MKKLVSILLLISMLTLCIAACGGDDNTNNGTTTTPLSQQEQYDLALSLLSEAKYSEAYKLFQELGDYEDSKDYVAHFHYIPTKLILSDGETTQGMRTTLNEHNLPKEIFYSFGEDEQLLLTLGFDQNGKLIKTTKPLDGEQEAVTNYIYNDSGKLIKIDSYNHKDYTEYTYDDGGKLVKKVYINSNPGNHDIYEYFYDDNGRLIKETYKQGPNNDVSGYITYTYDTDSKSTMGDNIITPYQASYIPEGYELVKQTQNPLLVHYEWHDANGNIIIFEQGILDSGIQRKQDLCGRLSFLSGSLLYGMP